MIYDGLLNIVRRTCGFVVSVSCPHPLNFHRKLYTKNKTDCANEKPKKSPPLTIFHHLIKISIRISQVLNWVLIDV